MRYKKLIRIALSLEILAFIITVIFLVHGKQNQSASITVTSDGTIKWVDFNVSYDALCKAYEADVSTYGKKEHIDWIQLLAYTAAKNGGEFKKSTLKTMDATIKKLTDGTTTLNDLTNDLKYYSYYMEAYSAILAGYVGEYEVQTGSETGSETWKKVYGLKAFSPIAKGFSYNDYDDFGVSRSFGYRRAHLGHDMMGLIGTPI